MTAIITILSILCILLIILIFRWDTSKEEERIKEALNIQKEENITLIFKTYVDLSVAQIGWVKSKLESETKIKNFRTTDGQSFLFEIEEWITKSPNLVLELGIVISSLIRLAGKYESIEKLEEQWKNT